MRHIVCYSGGLGSFGAAMRVIEKEGKDNTELIFTDTKVEDEDLYRFLDESAEFLGCELIKLSEGRDIWQVFEDVRYMGNSRIDPCSRILKRQLMRSYVEQNFMPDQVVLYVGIGWQEINRMPAITKHWQPYTIEAPMIDPPLVESQDIIKFLARHGISAPRLYDAGFMHNNCGGFCVKTGQAQFKLLLETFPERYAWHEEKQEQLFAKIGQHGFIRVTKDKKLYYLSLRQFRLHLQEGLPIDAYDFGGCGCFSDVE